MSTTPTSVRLDAATDERLDRLAERTGRSKTYLVSQAVQEHIEDMEDAEAAMEAYMEHVRSGEPFLTHEQVFGELDDDR